LIRVLDLAGFLNCSIARQILAFSFLFRSFRINGIRIDKINRKINL